MAINPTPPPEMQAEYALIRQKLEQNTLLEKQLKREITSWKTWFQNLPQVDKTHELEQLQFEVQWRSERLGELLQQAQDLQSEKYDLIAAMDAAMLAQVSPIADDTDAV